jgi:hypothetical protein
MAADLATKADLTGGLRDLELRLTIRFGTMLVVAVGLLLSGLAATTSIILNRLPASAPHAQHTTGFVLAGAGRGFDWDAYDQQQYACRSEDQIARECTRGPEFCDNLSLQEAQRQCSRFPPLPSQGRRDAGHP